MAYAQTESTHLRAPVKLDGKEPLAPPPKHVPWTVPTILNNTLVSTVPSPVPLTNASALVTMVGKAIIVTKMSTNARA